MAREKKSVQCYTEDHKTLMDLHEEHGDSVADLVEDAVAWLVDTMSSQPTKAQRRAERAERRGGVSPGSNGSHTPARDVARVSQVSAP
jgi:chloramphenicol 3-O-phosphotransferase